MNKQIIKWSRWIILLPTSICLPVICIFLTDLLPAVNFEDSSSKHFLHSLYPFITSIISILTAYIIAPNHKFRASTAIAVLWLLSLLTALSIVIFKVRVAGEQQYVVDDGMATISTLIGVAIGLMVGWRLQVKKKIPVKNEISAISQARVKIEHLSRRK